MDVPAHTVLADAVLPAVGVGFTVIAFVWAEDVPQEFDALTEIVPIDVPAVVVMLFVVDDPVQPTGSAHV